jgi:hypothetical protein
LYNEIIRDLLDQKRHEKGTMGLPVKEDKVLGLCSFSVCLFDAHFFLLSLSLSPSPSLFLRLHFPSPSPSSLPSLSPFSPLSLCLSLSSLSGPYVHNLSFFTLHSFSQFLSLFLIGQANRALQSVRHNIVFSKAHVVLSFTIAVTKNGLPSCSLLLCFLVVVGVALCLSVCFGCPCVCLSVCLV